MKKRVNWQLLFKYLKGSCNESELHDLGQWLQESPANEDFFSSFIEEWSSEDQVVFRSDVMVEWIKFKKSNGSSIKTDDFFLSLWTVPNANNGSYYLSGEKNKRNFSYRLYITMAIIILAIVIVFMIGLY